VDVCARWKGNEIGLAVAIQTNVHYAIIAQRGDNTETTLKHAKWCTFALGGKASLCAVEP